MAEDIKQFKKSMRKIMMKKRHEADPLERERFSEQIVQKLLNSRSYKDAKTIMAFISMADEVQLDPFFEQAFKDGKRLAIPVIMPTNVMRAVLLPSMDVLVEGAYGIKTVNEDDRIYLQPDAPDLIIVPGAAFDYLGHRLGLGGGYYDQFLARAHRAKKIALAFDFQLIYQVPNEPSDATVDAIVTQSKVVGIYDWGMQVWIKPETPPWL